MQRISIYQRQVICLQNRYQNVEKQLFSLINLRTQAMRNLLIRALSRFVIHPHREASRKGVFEFILREMRNRTLMEILELETANRRHIKRAKVESYADSRSCSSFALLWN